MTTAVVRFEARRRDPQSYFGANGPPAEAIAALKAHPRFPEAMRIIAEGTVALYRGNRLLNALVHDRSRLIIGYISLYLHFFRRIEDPHAGLSVSRMKALCVEQKICSANRAEAVLALMRLFGHLAAAPRAEDRRLRLLVPTDRLITLLQRRWQNQFEAMQLVLPESVDALGALRRPEFTAAFVGQIVEHFLAGFRFLDQAPDLQQFMDRNAGMVVLFNLMLAGEKGDTFPPARPVPVSISALASRFGVSRAHVRKLLRDAQEAGLTERLGTDESRLILSPRLGEAMQTFLATTILFFAHCAHAAVAEIGPESAVA